MTVSTTLLEPIVAQADTFATVRRDIHAHPELGFEEQRTSDLVAQLLTEWGIPIHRGLGKTGVVGIIKSGQSNRAVGLRADMDALPVTEFNTFGHASVTKGKMHACGHDGHTTMLLSAAHHLASHRNFDGLPAVMSECGIAPRVLTDIEAGRGSPTVETLEKLLRPFGYRVGVVAPPDGYAGVSTRASGASQPGQQAPRKAVGRDFPGELS